MELINNNDYFCFSLFQNVEDVMMRYVLDITENPMAPFESNKRFTKINVNHIKSFRTIRNYDINDIDSKNINYMSVEITYINPNYKYISYKSFDNSNDMFSTFTFRGLSEKECTEIINNIVYLIKLIRHNYKTEREKTAKEYMEKKYKTGKYANGENIAEFDIVEFENEGFNHYGQVVGMSKTYIDVIDGGNLEDVYCFAIHEFNKDADHCSLLKFIEKQDKEVNKKFFKKFFS